MPGAQINLNGIGMTFANRQAVIDAMVEIGGNTALAQDDVGMAQELRVRLGPGNSTMYRRYLDLNGDGDGDEDELWQMIPVENWLDLVSEGGSNGVVVQYHNEPVINQNTAKAFVAKNVEALRAAHRRNQPLGFYVFSVGNPHESLIRSGAFDQCIIEANENDELVLHEYFWEDPLADNEYGFLCFRLIEWLERRKFLISQGIPIKLRKFRIAEYGTDRAGGLNDGYKGRGWSAQIYLEKLLRGMDEYKRLAIEYGVEIYVNVFCVGSGFFNRWDSWNVEGEQVIYDGLRDWNRNNPMTTTVPAPTTGGKSAVVETLSGRAYVNIRNQPNLSGQDMGDLLEGDEVIYYPNSAFNGWVYLLPVKQVQRPTGRQNAAPGWTSLQGGEIKFKEIVPPAVGGLTQEQWDRLNQNNAIIKNAAAQIDALLLEVKPSSNDGGF